MIDVMQGVISVYHNNHSAVGVCYGQGDRKMQGKQGRIFLGHLSWVPEKYESYL